MNLANPTIGDLIDRLSILSLRAQELEGKPEAATRLAEEHQALTQRIVDKLLGTAWPQPAEMTKLLLLAIALGAINGRLWEVHERPEGLPLTYAMGLNAQRRRVAEEIG